MELPQIILSCSDKSLQIALHSPECSNYGWAELPFSVPAIMRRQHMRTPGWSALSRRLHRKHPRVTLNARREEYCAGEADP